MDMKCEIAGTMRAKKAVYITPKAELIQTQTYNLLKSYSFDLEGGFEEFPEGNEYNLIEE